VTRRRRQLQMRSSLLLLRSVILGNGDGLRVETNARSGNVYFALLTRSVKTCLCTRLLFSFFSCLLTRSHGSNISSCNMLEITCILRTLLFFTFYFLLFFTLLFLLRLLFLRTGICRMSVFYSIVFIHTVRILYPAGCLVRNKATLVMHLGMVSR
jgi:hypothetical protein